MKRVAVAVVTSFVLASCRAAPSMEVVRAEPAAVAPTVDAAPSADAQPVAVAVAEPACDGADGVVVVPRGPIAAQWDPRYARSGGEGTVDVHWCGEATVWVKQLILGPLAGRRWFREYQLDRFPVQRGAPVALEVNGQATPGALPLTLVVVDEAGGEHQTVSSLESVDDPARVAAIAACTACRGTWGAVGMMSYERCDCPTRDAGKRCTTDADCEGACLATGFEVVTDAAAVAAAACGRGYRLEQAVGTCHHHQLAFGCRPRLTTDDGPRCEPAGMGRRLSTVCTD